MCQARIAGPAIAGSSVSPVATTIRRREPKRRLDVERGDCGRELLVELDKPDVRQKRQPEQREDLGISSTPRRLDLLAATAVSSSRCVDERVDREGARARVSLWTLTCSVSTAVGTRDSSM